jgi:hypothetical protein
VHEFTTELGGVAVNKRGLALGVVIVAGLAVAVILAVLPRSHQPARPPVPGRDASRLGIQASNPIGPNATSTTLSDGETLVGYSILRPNDKLANDANITAVYADTKSGTVAVEYATGVQLLETPAGSNFETELPQIAADNGGTTGTADGVPALIIEEDQPGNCSVPSETGFCQPAQHNEGSVTFVVRGLQIQIMGYLSSSDLLRISDSVE